MLLGVFFCFYSPAIAMQPSLMLLLLILIAGIRADDFLASQSPRNAFVVERRHIPPDICQTRISSTLAGSCPCYCAYPYFCISALFWRTYRWMEKCHSGGIYLSGLLTPVQPRLLPVESGTSIARPCPPTLTFSSFLGSHAYPYGNNQINQ